MVRRVTVNTDTGNIIQDILVKDQPTGYDWHAALPDGVRNIQTRLYWQPAEPTMLGNEQQQRQLGNEQRQRPNEKVRVVIDDRLSPLPTLGRKPPIEIENFPPEAWIRQKENRRQIRKPWLSHERSRSTSSSATMIAATILKDLAWTQAPSI